jgi:polyhydroxyalkanoate synthesis regulator phasin
VAKAVIQGPLNRAQIDSVTYGQKASTDHKQLWEDTNTTLANHTTALTSQETLITALTARIAALEAKVG